jgi:hypothetical protein
MPDIVFPKLEDLPEELRSFAKAADAGGFVINLVANDKLKEFRENNIAVSKERDDLKAVVSQVHALFPEFNAEKVTAELTELRGTHKRVKDGTLKESTAIEAALAERTQNMKADYEGQINARAAEAKAAKDRNTILESRIKTQAIRQTILGAVMDEKAGVQSSAIEDIVQRALGVFSVEGDGERVIPKSGDAIIYGSDGTSPMSPAEWVESLKGKSPHLFKQSTGGGGNLNGGGDKRFGGFSTEEIAKMSPEEKIRIANEAVRPRGFA